MTLAWRYGNISIEVSHIFVLCTPACSSFTQLLVPKVFVGILIGRGGERITDIQQCFNVKIHFQNGGSSIQLVMAG